MRRKNKRTLLSCCIALALILACAIALKMSHGSLVFRRYVLKPIPKSVKNIKVHRRGWLSWNIFSHIYVMHFEVNKADVELILTSRRFKEIGDMEYDNGILCLMEDPSSGEYLPLYALRKEQPGPEWFRLEQWDNPKAYRFREMSITYQEHVQVLIYNEELAEAYFVERQGGYW